MKKSADLHLHTKASDSSLSPEELIKYSQIVELTTIAITDHDTIDSVLKAYQICKTKNIEFISGIELTVQEKQNEYHILGYFIDLHDEDLLEILTTLKKFRFLRAKKIVEKLNGSGFSIDFDFIVQTYNHNCLGRPHIAKTMVDTGQARSLQEAYNKFLCDNGPAYVPKYNLPLKDAVALIRKNGGVPILAHPYMYIKKESELKKFTDAGVKGLEVFHSEQNAKLEKYFLNLANKHNLLVTGGSDYHGILNERIMLGQRKIDYRYVEILKYYAKKNLPPKNLSFSNLI